jgi:hypothetical protein
MIIGRSEPDYGSQYTKIYNQYEPLWKLLDP